MHTVELLHEALDLAGRLGYEIRQDWLDGSGGGGCELRGRKIFFLDLSVGPADQLDQVIETLQREPDAVNLPMVHQLRKLVKVRRIA